MRAPRDEWSRYCQSRRPAEYTGHRAASLQQRPLDLIRLQYPGGETAVPRAALAARHRWQSTYAHKPYRLAAHPVLQRARDRRDLAATRPTRKGYSRPMTM